VNVSQESKALMLISTEYCYVLAENYG